MQFLFYYKKRIWDIFKTFFKARLYIKLSKYLFNISFILINKDKEIERNCVATNLNCFKPDFVYKIQSFPTFINFYYQYLNEFSKIIDFFIDITRNISYKTQKNLAFWKRFSYTITYKFFYKLIISFIYLQFLTHFNKKRQIKL